MPKKLLTIKVSKDFYNRLKINVPQGQVSSFIEEVIDEKLKAKAK